MARGCGVLGRTGADLVDLLDCGDAVGDDSAGHRIHRLVLAQQARGRRGAGPRETAMKKQREVPAASVSAVRRDDALDVSNLPSYGFSHRSLMWWGTAGMCAIEGMAFAFMIVVYFYLRALSRGWPGPKAAPDLLWGTLNVVLILASAIPNTYVDRAAIDQDVRRVRIGLV